MTFSENFSDLRICVDRIEPRSPVQFYFHYLSLARHQNQPTVDLSSQNRKRSAEPELFESLRSKTGRDRRLREVDQHDLRAYIFDSQNSERSKEGEEF
jgi:hypothetical protein